MEIDKIPYLEEDRIIEVIEACNELIKSDNITKDGIKRVKIRRLEMKRMLRFYKLCKPNPKKESTSNKT